MAASAVAFGLVGQASEVGVGSKVSAGVCATVVFG